MAAFEKLLIKFIFFFINIDEAKKTMQTKIQIFVFIFDSLINENVCLNSIEGLYRLALFTVLKIGPLL